MSYYYRTQVPNILFDTYLIKLSESELKVLLVIIRQTYGWIDKRTGKSKKWDWISRQFFVKKTSLSLRSVSEGISKLHKKGFIKIKNEKGYLLTTSRERKHAYKLYYSPSIESAYAKSSR